jgi:tripartite-type tricarboxylate transporter receptor subunit TctC
MDHMALLVCPLDAKHRRPGVLMTKFGVGAVIIFLLAAGSALAQTYPSRPVRVVVGFTPGGGVDINARLLCAKLSDLLGQQFVVENKPGAGTNIANETVAKAAADGYTLLFTSPAVAINMSLYRHPPYDALRDLAGVAVFSESTNLLVVPAAFPARSVKELVAMAKARPGSLNYSSAGQGTTQHLAGELFKLRTGTDIVHVPYKGSAPSLTALIAGDVQLSFVNPVAVGPHVKAGRLRALAVAGAKRTALLPDVPTMKEAGVAGVEVPLWYGLLAPKATPRDIVHTLAGAVAKAAHAADMREKLAQDGAEPVGNSPEDFDRQLREEVERWAEVVKVSGARAD